MKGHQEIGKEVMTEEEEIPMIIGMIDQDPDHMIEIDAIIDIGDMTDHIIEIERSCDRNCDRDRVKADHRIGMEIDIIIKTDQEVDLMIGIDLGLEEDTEIVPTKDILLELDIVFFFCNKTGHTLEFCFQLRDELKKVGTKL